MEGVRIETPDGLCSEVAKMTKKTSAAVNDQLSDSNPSIAELHRENRALQAELDQVEPLISAAVLAATAFRMRDQEALVSALRMLVRATRLFEANHACA